MAVHREQDPAHIMHDAACPPLCDVRYRAPNSCGCWASNQRFGGVVSLGSVEPVEEVSRRVRLRVQRVLRRRSRQPRMTPAQALQ